jgi:hypothetical protein
MNPALVEIFNGPCLRQEARGWTDDDPTILVKYIRLRRCSASHPGRGAFVSAGPETIPEWGNGKPPSRTNVCRILETLAKHGGIACYGARCVDAGRDSR